MQAITITRAQRDAIYGELLVELTAVGDIYIVLDRGDYEKARRLREHFVEDMRLLDDLRWEPSPTCEYFEITFPAERLACLMGRLHQLASEALTAHVGRPDDDERLLAERKVAACAAYGSVLSQLATDPKGA
jgi:hypothetical protein